MGTFPGKLAEAVADWLAGRSAGLALRSAALGKAYARGETSSTVDPAAYLAARLPATFAACWAVLAELTGRLEPASLLDVGAGPGTASWAALARFPSLQRITQVEREAAFAGLAALFNSASGRAPLHQARLLQISVENLPECERADLVMASYVLSELRFAAMPATVELLWQRANLALVLIEPGTPQGFARIRAAREVLVAAHAHIAAPCTHAATCPMAGGDWCHFKVRLPRSRLHMHAKGANVPFEDEAFSYLVALREPGAAAGHRIVAPPVSNKTGVTMKLCGPEGLTTRYVPPRDRQSFRYAKKLQWGDRL